MYIKNNQIKSYISIRNTSTNISSFFTHYCSVIIPTYSQLREFFAARKEAGETDITSIKQKFINKFISLSSEPW